MKSALLGLTPLIQHTFVKFASVGVVNTLSTLAIIFVLKFFFSVPDSAANFAGYTVGLAISFGLNKRWTFRHDAGAIPALGRFLLVFAASYVLNIAVVLMALKMGVNSYFAHITGMPFYSLTFYAGCRLFAFAPGTSDAAAMRRVDPQEQVARLWYIAAIVPFIVVMLYRLGDAPLEIWDEARLANNAIEMARNGFSLITTYEGVPDHWNTKPPLLIWAMAASIRVFGETEWAVRIPSVLAALATASIVYWFCVQRFRRPFIGFAAVVLMLCMPGYVHTHAARTGDYDVLLTLFTTGYLLAGYLFVHAPPERRKTWLFICSACISLAFLTKTIQGLILLPPLAAYVVYSGRIASTLRMPQFYWNALMVVAIPLVYYAVREAVDPGYFSAALNNDLLGRYATVIEKHSGGPLWYVVNVQLHPWLVPGLLCGFWIMSQGQREERSVGQLIGVATLFYLVVVSSASTKLSWYLVPLCPLLALLLGMMAEDLRLALVERYRLSEQVARNALILACAVGCVAIMALNFYKADRTVRTESADALDRYSVFLRDTVKPRGEWRKLLVVHPGYPNYQEDAFYVAPTLFYAKALRSKGLEVEVRPPSALQQVDADALVLCGDALVEEASSIFVLRALERNGGCGIYGVAGRRPDLPAASPPTPVVAEYPRPARHIAPAAIPVPRPHAAGIPSGAAVR